MSGSAASPNVIAQLVETMRTLAGPHPGFRPVLAFRVAVPTRMAPLPVSVRSDSLAERGLPTRDQEAHATFSEGLLSCGGRAFEQSKRVRVVSMAIRIRRSRSATARRARP
jgi:hypothetical protein